MDDAFAAAPSRTWTGPEPSSAACRLGGRSTYAADRSTRGVGGDDGRGGDGGRGGGRHQLEKVGRPRGGRGGGGGGAPDAAGPGGARRGASGPHRLWTTQPFGGSAGRRGRRPGRRPRCECRARRAVGHGAPRAGSLDSIRSARADVAAHRAVRGGGRSGMLFSAAPSMGASRDEPLAPGASTTPATCSGAAPESGDEAPDGRPPRPPGGGGHAHVTRTRPAPRIPRCTRTRRGHRRPPPLCWRPQCPARRLLTPPTGPCAWQLRRSVARHATACRPKRRSWRRGRHCRTACRRTRRSTRLGRRCGRVATAAAAAATAVGLRGRGRAGAGSERGVGRLKLAPEHLSVGALRSWAGSWKSLRPWTVMDVSLVCDGVQVARGRTGYVFMLEKTEFA